MSADLDQNPSPADLAERERENKERKAREDAEQAQLPYKWTQTIRDVDVTAPIPGNLKGRDLDVLLTKNKIRVAIKGQEPLIEVCPSSPHPENYTVHSKSTQLKNSRLTTQCSYSGRLPSRHSRRRILLDPRDYPHPARQGNQHPSR
jgi:hypothetical protein